MKLTEDLRLGADDGVDAEVEVRKEEPLRAEPTAERGAALPSDALQVVRAAILLVTRVDQFARREQVQAAQHLGVHLSEADVSDFVTR